VLFVCGAWIHLWVTPTAHPPSHAYDADGASFGRDAFSKPLFWNNFVIKVEGKITNWRIELTSKIGFEDTVRSASFKE
jgi:hypothetical protein|tara:strand:- start:101 stop:334 length:234 start_codon:yes stop_codon:yes gene_type:complete